MKEKYYFKEFPILENDQVLLREFKPSEAEQIIDLSVYDGFYAKTTEDVLQIQDKIKKDYLNGDGVSWGIYKKGSGEIVGTCCFCRGYKNNEGEIGYVLKEAYRGQHFMTEAGKLVTDFGLQVMNLSKVVAYTDNDNKASQAVLNRLGYKVVEHEGEDVKFEISNTVKKLSKSSIPIMMETVKEKGRHLEYLLLKHLFQDESSNIIKELKKYQNADGGFGNALEPDLRVPDSSAVATEFAINILSRLSESDNELVQDIVNYLESSFDEDKEYWEISPKNVEDYPRAVWWNRDSIESFGKHNPSATLLGFLYKHKTYVKKLDVDALIEKLEREILEMSVEHIEAHTIFCLIDLLSHLPKDRLAFRNKINEAIKYTIELDPAKWATYAPEPIKYIKDPNHALYERFSSVVNINLDNLIETLNDDMVWDPKHTWHQDDDYFEQHVKNEWMGVFTYDNLSRLMNFNRID